jgi:hypothetical protein
MSRALQELAGRLSEQRERLLLEPNLRLPTWVLKARQAHYKVRSDGDNCSHASESEHACQNTYLAKQRAAKPRKQRKARADAEVQE